MQIHSNSGVHQNLASPKPVAAASKENLAAEKPAGGGHDIPAVAQAKDERLGQNIDFKA